ncbi:MAG TPA: CcmD family protein [Ferruginibacter sp.]|jgi:hypothetical protein|nr:CcmD family protein [Ferruginibacter sp.]
MTTKLFTRLWLLALAMITSTVGFAQDKPEMADLMRSNGKIYVVVAVCLTILIGLFLYVMLVDRKMSKIEKDN